jgi:hypothetical protein
MSRYSSISGSGLPSPAPSDALGAVASRPGHSIAVSSSVARGLPWRSSLWWFIVHKVHFIVTCKGHISEIPEYPIWIRFVLANDHIQARQKLIVITLKIEQSPFFPTHSPDKSLDDSRRMRSGLFPSPTRRNTNDFTSECRATNVRPFPEIALRSA